MSKIKELVEAEEIEANENLDMLYRELNSELLNKEVNK